jgi:3-deoxy-manno-octulosonate cytidylyltransferase (CMP-KDO synthetase)
METGGFEWGLKHLGIYAYRRELLSAYSSWEPTPLEKRECLEQLRFMDRDVPIRVAVVDHDSIGVDTPAELELLNQSS